MNTVIDVLGASICLSEVCAIMMMLAGCEGGHSRTPVAVTFPPSTNVYFVTNMITFVIESEEGNVSVVTVSNRKP